MWITLFSVCVSAIFRSNAQELTSFDSQTATENSYANQEANWDSTRPPVTLSIRDGRSRNLTESVTDSLDQPLFYTNHWKPILMPIGFSNSRNRDRNQDENVYSTEHQFLPTFLRRPDSEPNGTVAVNYYPQTADGGEYSHVPYPFESLFYYPSESDSYPNWNAQEVQADNTQNVSKEDVKPVTSYPVTTVSVESTTENQPVQNYPAVSENTQPSEVYRYPSFVPQTAFLNNPMQQFFPLYGRNEAVDVNRKQAIESASSTASEKASAKETFNEARAAENVNSVPQRYQPLPFYRNNPFFMPPMSPAFFNSYPFLPYTRDGIVPPVMPYPVFNPNFIREQGSEVSETIENVPEQQEQPIEVPDRLAENIPSETSTNILPPQPLPLPVPGFPFGQFPPPFAPPVLPNLPVPGNIPLIPFASPQPRSVRKPGVITDAILPPVPLEPNQNTVPQVEYLEPVPQEEILTDAQVIPEEVVASEKPAAPKSPYEFGFDMNDGKGTDQHRKEVSDGSGVVTGSYGYRDISGVYRFVNYIADKDGFRAFIKSNEPGVASSGSADVVVMAERPPPPAIAEGLKVPDPEAVVIPDESTGLLSAASSIEN